MSLRISGKHMDIGEAFRARIDTRIVEAIDKYFGGGFSGHVTVAKSGSRYNADCMIHLDSGVSLHATSDAQDPIPAFEGAADKLEKRLRRYNRKLKSRNFGGNADGAAMDVSYTVMAGLPDDDEEEVDENYAPAIVAESTLSLKAMSVASAVVELDTKESPVYVFRNAGSDQVNIVYRRPDGNIGWIEPSSPKTTRE